jgi:cytochrome c oxidase subunit I
VSISVPAYWLLGLLFFSGAGTLAGGMLANAGVDGAFDNTYYVVAHFHYVLALATLFAFFAAWYFFFSKIIGYSYSVAIAKVHFGLTFVGANLLFFPQPILGLVWTPRSYADYPEAFVYWNRVASFGSYIMAFATILFLYGAVEALWKKRRAVRER